MAIVTDSNSVSAADLGNMEYDDMSGSDEVS